jgi:lipopolysaccharide exporter
MSLALKIVNSSALLITLKFGERLIGLVSLLILARLLIPNDFSIIALTAIVVYFFDILANAGSEQYIIQKKNVTNDDLNTAWTIDIILKSALCGGLILLSGFISDYFVQPKLQLALCVSSFLLIINALKNPGLLLLKQNLDYKKIFRLSLIQKLTSFIFVVAIAYHYRSFWALIIGDLISSFIYTIGSYYVNSHRPMLTLKRKEDQWVFSKWLLVKSIVGYIRAQIDTLIVSKIFPGALTGQYYMTRNIAMLPCHNILSPAIEPLLAAFSKNNDDKHLLAKKINYCLFVITCITIPMVIFIWQSSNLIVAVLLGEQWLESAELLSYFVLLLLYFPYILVFEQVLLAMGKVKTAFKFDIYSILIIVIGFMLFTLDTTEKIAIIRGVTGVISLFCLAGYLRIVIPFSLKLVSTTIIACFIISFYSFYIATSCINFLNFNDFFTLTFTLLFFLICYSMLLVLLFIVLAKFNPIAKNAYEKIYTLAVNKLGSFRNKTNDTNSVD